ncbi:glycosyltransferase family 4 protein [Fimbriiglobus ruber]|uniref:Glycosyl transferase, group 1 n=1 Tax=Fimbriiglobus ruber TaxID=1908690 RepID=A0A225D3I6_9BACT|nr:glycosyltransferase family 4 protein [Fimbriiglobus ruber]OWK34164.1 Glycosyl transferase, group 1 [Fimbriiglobus ruber]
MTRKFNRRVVTLFPHYNTGGANSHIVAGILSGMVGLGADVSLWVPASGPGAARSYTKNAVPGRLRGLSYRIAGVSRVNRFAERRFLASLRPDDLAYIWPGASLDVYLRAKDRGAMVAAENINCHTATARAILEREGAALGLPPDHGITDEAIAHERAVHEAADVVFSPNQMVDESLRQNDVPEAKILPCSYGWAPERIGGPPANPRAIDGRLRVLFVGLACVRKGVPRLLDAWARAGLTGELQFAGRVSDDLLKSRAGDFARSDVRRFGHVPNVGDLYRAADVFAFPSLEEGGPLVTYEAMGCGLPVVVSPMGAGRVARGEEDGAIVLPPEDVDGWAAAFRRLADPELRAEFGRRAAARAAAFTWDGCAATRLERLAAVCPS